MVWEVETVVDEGLMERIATVAGCEYFSDIKYKVNMQKVRTAAATIPPEDYPLEIWSYALSYVTEQALRFETTDELAAFLQEDWMNGNGGE